MTREEAIERVRTRFDKWALDNEDLTALQALGLVDAESEDERIRKELIEQVGDIVPAPYEADENGIILKSYYDRIARYRAWLEKQKDANKAIEVVDRIDKYIDEHLANAHDMKDSNPDKKYYRGWDDALGEMARILQDVYSNEKQEEQKPIKWTDLTWKDIVELEGIINNVHYDFRNGIGQESFGKEVLERFREYKGDEYLDEIEQKPEEDEEIIYSLRSFLIQAQQSGGYGSIQIAQIEKCLNWLKSLSLNLKKKNEDVAKLCSNEWSEEDEKIAKEIEEELWYPGDFPDYPSKEENELYDDCQRRLNWFKNKLKSLRSQSKKELSIEKAIQWLDDTFYFSDNSSGRGRDCEITTHDFDSLEEMYDSFRKAVIVDSEPHWKPSEEQMGALRECGECKRCIKKLYEDLQKRYGTC